MGGVLHVRKSLASLRVTWVSDVSKGRFQVGPPGCQMARKGGFRPATPGCQMARKGGFRLATPGSQVARNPLRRH